MEAHGAPRAGGGVTGAGRQDSLLIAVNGSGAIAAWSPGAQQLLGYTSQQAVGRPLAELLAPGASLPLRETPAPAVFDGALRLRHRDGRLLDVTVQLHHLVAEEGAALWLLTAPPAGAPPVRRAPAELDEHALLEWLFSSAPVALTVYDAELRSVRQNAAMVRLSGVPDEQRRMMYLPEVLSGPDVADWERQLRDVVETGRSVTDFTVRARTRADPDHEHVFSCSASPLRGRGGQAVGVCATVADATRHQRVTERLQLLNEASSYIGSTLDITRTAEEMAELAVPRLADFVSVDLLDPLLRGDEPGPAGQGAVLRRIAQQSVAPGAPESVTAPGEVDWYPAYSPAAHCLVTGLPMLLQADDPAVARWEAKDPARAAKNLEFGIHSWMLVPLSARGTTLGVAAFIRWRRAEPFEADDLLLAGEFASRAAVSLDNARRFTRERAAAITLQHSLLPQRLPQQTAVDVATRYLPAGGRSGVGGDWFDVIPLSGARVALVVGDVVGHGMHAAATMGRLRTAVHTLADIDLTPDELLTHLDDLVTRIVGEDEPTDGGAPATDLWATCLYAVYNPVTRLCSTACAGNPPPVLRTPDGRAALLDLPIGPPLGLGGLPFEATEVELPEGSLLALYTDGLLGSRRHTLEAGLDQLRGALTGAARSLDALCDTVISTVLPERPDDDVALLIARTRALRPDQVAIRDVPLDPADVARARSWAADRLASWGLEEIGFVTELVVSELVTNAIRHAIGPVQLRLIRDRTLFCEVSDASSTAPHLRRARVLDEGGRGLLLVAQLTQRWGTRQTPEGKTIWCEQVLPEDPPPRVAPY